MKGFVDATLSTPKLRFLGPEHHDLGESGNMILEDPHFLKQYKLKFRYPYFLEAVFLSEQGQLKAKLELYLQSCLDLQADYLIRTVTLANTIYSIGIDLKAQIVYLYSQRLSDELFLAEAFESTPEGDQLNRFTKAIQSIDLLETPTEISIIRKRYNLQPYDSTEILQDPTYQKVIKAEQELKEKLVSEIDQYNSSFFEKVSDFFLVLTSEYDLIRIHLLKFLAVLPCLDHDTLGVEVKRIFLESLRRFLSDNRKARRKEFLNPVKSLPLSYDLLLKSAYIACKLLPANFLSFILRQSTRYMAKRFIAGEDIKNSKKVLLDLNQTERNATIDQLGELVLTIDEADLYQDRVIEIIEGMKNIFTPGSRNKVGILKAHVSIKVSALASDFVPEDFEYTYRQVGPRLKRILMTAKENEVFINVDAEHYHYRDIVWEIYKKTLSEDEELYKWEDTGIVIQAYLKNAFEHFKEIQFFSQQRKILMPVRLVKGAYWDAETVEAEAHSDSPPQFINKVETDIHFRQLIYEILKEPFLQLCLASHNLSDHCFAQALREEQIPAAHPIEHQCLHMTYEALSTGLAKLGFTVRNYVPVGDLLVGMAYLVRRIMENSSQVGILAMMRSHRDQLDNLDLSENLTRKIQERLYRFESNFEIQSREFFNNAPLKTYLKKHRDVYHLKKDELPLSLDQKEGRNLYQVYSPSNKHELLGQIRHFQPSEAKGIISNSLQAYLEDEWSQDFRVRAKALVQASHLFKFHRDSLSHLIVAEAGKTHKEALADVDEAIDFINFYLREELIFLSSNPLAVSKGVILVIAPWNFPLAIPCGMAVASLIAGNAVCLKSAEQTPLIAETMTKIFHFSGVPENILQHVPGVGSEVGEELGRDPRIAGVVFTGSKKVGCHLYQLHSSASYQHPRYLRPYQKTMIAEMGGKNAIIVTNNAELDETVEGILYSAFAHAGQKCSAASRVLVHNSIKENFLKRFLKSSDAKIVGESDKWSTLINPLISEREQKRIYETRNRVIEECKIHGGIVHLDKVHLGEVNHHGVGPLIVELPKERAVVPESEAQKEHFAPVIHIIGFDSLTEALDILNSTEYGLTAGLYSQSQDEIDLFTEKAKVGNLYINRPNTGARVAIEPFGGFRYSGTGPKAGGREYLRELQVKEESFPEIKSLISDEGSQYFQEPSENKESYEERVRKVLSKEKIDRQFYQGFYEYLKPDYQINNRLIPGQLSFNRFELSKKKVLIKNQQMGKLCVLTWL